MNSRVNGEADGLKVFCGIDWAELHHDIALVDQDGQLIAKRRITDSVEGFTELLTMLAEAGDTDQAPIPVAIETPRGLLVAALRATGRSVYAINPMAVARYRERWTLARSKSDHADAVVLANILRTDTHAHRPLPLDSELVQAIAVLARAQQDATWRRTKAVQELRSLLREYYPGFLAAFTRHGATNLASSDARAVLAIAPTPTEAAISPRPASPPRCAAAVANATSNSSPTRCTRRCANLICASNHASSRLWAPRPWRFWPCSTPPPPAWSNSATPSARRSTATPTTQ